jgi:hypothetical protein
MNDTWLIVHIWRTRIRNEWIEGNALILWLKLESIDSDLDHSDSMELKRIDSEYGIEWTEIEHDSEEEEEIV